jgi:thiosulfate/3-mercaptopyruvate sulfurtransferase
MNPKFSAYAHPEALVDGAWLQEHLTDSTIRIVESNEDVLLYDTGHIPGAVHIDWRGDLQDNTLRDYVSPEKFAEICAKNGITPDTTVVFMATRQIGGRPMHSGLFDSSVTPK